VRKIVAVVWNAFIFGGVLWRHRHRGMTEHFCWLTVSRPALGPTASSGSFPGGKAAGARSWPLTFFCCQGQEYVALHPSPIHLYGVYLCNTKGLLHFSLIQSQGKIVFQILTLLHQMLRQGLFAFEWLLIIILTGSGNKCRKEAAMTCFKIFFSFAVTALCFASLWSLQGVMEGSRLRFRTESSCPF